MPISNLRFSPSWRVMACAAVCIVFAVVGHAQTDPPMPVPPEEAAPPPVAAPPAEQAPPEVAPVQEEAPPALSEAAPAEAAEAQPSPPAPEEEPGGYHSLMYSEEEIQALAPAVKVFRIRLQNGEPIEEEQQAAPTVEGLEEITPGYYEYPQFFLKSVIYHHPQRWIVWLNNQKYSADTPLPETADLTVDSISERTVTFKWRPSVKERLKWDVVGGEDVRIDAAARTIYFTLRPNQTFSSYSMQVVEGKVTPTVISSELVTPNTASDPGLSTPGVLPMQPMPGMTPEGIPNPPAPPDTGLGGLINRYQQLELRP